MVMVLQLLALVQMLAKAVPLGLLVLVLGLALLAAAHSAQTVLGKSFISIFASRGST